MNWTDKTNKEINAAVAKIEWPGCAILNGAGESVIVLVDGRIERQAFDPCNNWGDGGPIIIKGCISTVKFENGCLALSNWDFMDVNYYDEPDDACVGHYDAFTCTHDNTLRAAMCVYVEMNAGDA